MKTAFKGLVHSATVYDVVSGGSFKVQSDIFSVGAGELDIQAALSNYDLAHPLREALCLHWLAWTAPGM